VNRFRTILLAFTLFSLPLFSEEGILTWEEAQDRALNDSYDLSMDYAEIEAREGEAAQVRLYDNPIFSYSVENVLGNKRWRGWRGAESRYEIAQPIVVGGKRGHLAKGAQVRTCAAVKGYEASQLGVLNRLSKAFLNVAALQEIARLVSFQKEISQEIFNTVSEKLEAGKVSPIHRSKAALQLANGELAVETSRVDLQVAKENLALLLSASCPDFFGVFYPFFQLDCPCSFEDCFQEIRIHPVLALAEYEQLASEEDLLFEKSSRIPDVIVSLGYKTIRDTHEKGMIMGVAIPLPFFNRNQGNIQRAGAETGRLADQVDAVRLKLENRLSTVHKELVLAYGQAVKFKSVVLQMAESSFEYAKSGYEEGKFEYLDLLDAQRALFETQERFIDVLLEYHTKCSDLEYLTL
jgi:outer membrane protein, heavy metal efflux system